VRHNHSLFPWLTYLYKWLNFCSPCWGTRRSFNVPPSVFFQGTFGCARCSCRCNTRWELCKLACWLVLDINDTNKISLKVHVHWPCLWSPLPDPFLYLFQCHLPFLPLASANWPCAHQPSPPPPSSVVRINTPLVCLTETGITINCWFTTETGNYSDY